MGEAIWTTVTTRVPAAWFTGVVFDHKMDRIDGPIGTLGAWCENIDIDGDTKGELEFVFSGDANYGYMCDDDVSAALDLLEAAEVPYIAASNAKYECEASRRTFDGFRFYEEDVVEGSGPPVLTQSAYEQILNGTHEWAKSPALYFAGPCGPNADFPSIAHLMARPNPWPAEEEEPTSDTLPPFPGTECPHCQGKMLLVEGGYERTWTMRNHHDFDDSMPDQLTAVSTSGSEAFSDDGDGVYVTRCATCLAVFEVPGEWEWD